MPETEVVKGRWYPEMPPMLDGETSAQYTDRLTGADRSDRRPYDHRRYRQCSIGWHDECSANGTDDKGCECPHHTDPDYIGSADQFREQVRAEVERRVKDAFYDERNAGGTMDHAAEVASREVLAYLVSEELL